MHKTSAVILAAGLGTRLKQPIPKPLVALMGKPLFLWIVDVLTELGIDDIIAVIQPETESVFRQYAPDFKGSYAYQLETKGTADAALSGIRLARGDKVVIVNGDAPCVPLEALKTCLNVDRGLIGFTVEKNEGYGIIACSIHQAMCVHEATHESGLANAGVYVVPRVWGEYALEHVEPQGAKNELWITEIIAQAWAEGTPFSVIEHGESWQYSGINTTSQWVSLEEKLQELKATELLDNGVYLEARDSLRLSLTMDVAPGVRIGRGCIFEGKVVLASGVVIEPYCSIKNASIGENTKIASFSSIVDSCIEQNASIGPYAHIQQSHCQEATVVGNFVEVKRTILGPHTKAKHLAYLGDLTTERYVNLGAGVITCNYDGLNKHTTHIQDGAFIGAQSTLIAPISIGSCAVIAAGTVLSQSAPAYKLTLGRVRPTVMDHALCHKLVERLKKNTSIET